MLLQLERAVALEALLRHPSQPWLWLSPCAASPMGARPIGRGVQLYRSNAGYSGELRCALPFPFPSESLQAIVVEHAVIAPADVFLQECARVLMPGGRLYLFTLNPYSPYHVRWFRQGQISLGPRRWRVLVQRSGLQCCGRERFLGPVWRASVPSSGSSRLWQAVCLLQAEKRVVAAVPPAPLAVRWQRPVITI